MPAVLHGDPAGGQTLPGVHVGAVDNSSTMWGKGPFPGLLNYPVTTVTGRNRDSQEIFPSQFTLHPHNAEGQTNCRAGKIRDNDCFLQFSGAIASHFTLHPQMPKESSNDKSLAPRRRVRRSVVPDCGAGLHPASGFVTRARRRLEIGAQVENLPHNKIKEPAVTRGLLLCTPGKTDLSGA